MSPGKRRTLTESALHGITDRLKTLKARVGAKVERPFRIIKIQFRFIKARYIGMAKNRAQLYLLFDRPFNLNLAIFQGLLSFWPYLTVKHLFGMDTRSLSDRSNESVLNNSADLSAWGTSVLCIAYWWNQMTLLGWGSSCSAKSSIDLPPFKAARATLARNSGEKSLGSSYRNTFRRTAPQ